MLFDIIKRLAEDTGLHLEQDRLALVNIANRSAEMLYKRLECNAIMREVTVLVPTNLVISLPSFIGPLRGMRESQTDINFDLNTQSYPRFIKNDWQYKWKNWRELQGSAIGAGLNVIAPLTIEVSAVEATPVTIKISGKTNNAQRLEESILLNEVSATTTKSFGPHIDSIACFDARQYDITIKDDDGNEIAILYNNESKTHYKLIDVSEFHWSRDVSDGNTTVELLYKQPFYKFINDSDEFAAQGYEDAIYFGAMSLWAAPQQGKEQLALMYGQQAMLEPQSDKSNEELHQNKKLQFGRNPFYNQIRRSHYNVPFLNGSAGN